LTTGSQIPYWLLPPLYWGKEMIRLHSITRMLPKRYKVIGISFVLNFTGWPKWTYPKQEKSPVFFSHTKLFLWVLSSLIPFEPLCSGPQLSYKARPPTLRWKKVFKDSPSSVEFSICFEPGMVIELSETTQPEIAYQKRRADLLADGKRT